MAQIAAILLSPVRVLARPAVRASLAALLLIVAIALPALAEGASAAGSGGTEISLTSKGASPTSGTTDTKITFAVLYQNSLALAPDYVHVRVAGSVFDMSPVTGDTWKKGVRFEVATRLPAGTWTARFEATDRNDAFTQVTGPTVVITGTPTPAPTATPRPTPSPTPAPTATPKPTPAPTATPKPTPAPTASPKTTPAPTATPKPTPAPTASPWATATPKPTPAPTAKPGTTPKPTAKPKPGASAKPGSGPGSGPKATPGPGNDPSSPDDGPTGSPDPSDGGVAILLPGGLGSSGPDGTGGFGGEGGSGGAGSPSGDGSGNLGPAGSTGGGSGASLPAGPSSLLAILLKVMPTVVVTTGAVTMAMAFLTFGKRRRDGQPIAPDDVLRDAAGRGTGYVPSGFAPSMVLPNAAAAAAAIQAVALPVAALPDTDAHMPRWRRPSLMEARKNDPMRSGNLASSGVHLTFEGSAGQAVAGLERRLIRYRVVSLLDTPDEVRGVEIGILDQGDEVVLMEKRGTYWRVLCPDGREGWLHKMVLGDVVIDAGSQGASWTSGDEGPAPGGFEDVLRAYKEARRQFGEA